MGYWVGERDGDSGSRTAIEWLQNLPRDRGAGYRVVGSIGRGDGGRRKTPALPIRVSRARRAWLVFQILLDAQRCPWADRNARRRVHGHVQSRERPDVDEAVARVFKPEL